VKQNYFRARYSAFDAPLIDINRKQIQYDDQQCRALDGSVFRPRKLFGHICDKVVWLNL
jgi:hypothetical protein